MFKFITGKSVWVNLLAAIAFIALLVLGFFFSLSWITSHGQSEVVPNVYGQNIIAATKTLEAKGFEVEIIDSVFIDTVARLSVVKQSPEPDARVKAGRTVYLTINRAVPPEVEMPGLIGFSIKSAQLMLQSLNLKLGDTSYKPDFARNAVLEQWYNGKEIKPGTKIPMGSSIDFVLGSGLGSEDLEVPNLIGLRVADAVNVLKSMNLNVGPIVARTAVADTLSAFVIDQTPPVFSEPFPGQKVKNKLRAGQIVDLYISNTPPAPSNNNTDTIN